MGTDSQSTTGFLYGAPGYYRGRYRGWNQTLLDGDFRGESCNCERRIPSGVCRL
jgi:hypothetical protein